MSFRVEMPTFAGGEIGPDLASRFDTAKYKTALRKARNTLGLVGGGLYGRPGLQYCGTLHDSAHPGRQVPFQFSPTQGYSLVFSDKKLRLIYDGGYVLDHELIVTGISNASPATVTCPAHGWVVSQDVLFQDQQGMVEINGLIGRVVAVVDADNVTVDINTLGFGVWTGSTGGVAGASAGGSGGHAPPPPPVGPGAPPAPPPPFVPTPAPRRIPPGTQEP